MAVEIDEVTLNDIAERTGGRYFRADDAEALVDVYAEIDRLERTRITEERSRQYEELYPLPLAAALLLAAFGWLGRAAVFVRVP
jgi:Ca-activated chloride channel family protein